MNDIGNTLVSIFMFLLFPVLLPVILFVMIYWMICSVVYTNKEVNDE